MITEQRHPFWNSKQDDWEKWRLIYDGGTRYVDRYLEKFSAREDSNDFDRRKRIAPRPNFAKAAINDIKNAIFSRLIDVTRRGGSPSYQEAIQGIDFGVDLHGASMNSFMGQDILPELLTMSRVGVFVDMPPVTGNTLRDFQGARPYLYSYKAENILSWSFRPGRPDEFDALLLRDFVEIKHDDTGLPAETSERFRFMFIGDDGKVHVQFFKQVKSDDPLNPRLIEVQVDRDGLPTDEDIILDIEIIPFVLVELIDSLLADVSNHQIALLNLESSDINYALMSNYPFYVEQQDERAQSPHLKTGTDADDGTSAHANTKKDKEIKVGTTQGRRYGKGLNEPAFIHPSSEPLKASIEKQERLKDDIRRLVNLALSNIKPKMASAESKAIDERGLEAGLSNIGLELERVERKIAKYWTMYEGNDQIATVRYPIRYDLKSDEDRRKNTKELGELRLAVPSVKFQKTISAEMARELLGARLSTDELDIIVDEIENTDITTTDFEIVEAFAERGILSLEFIAKLFGVPQDVVREAQKEHAERARRIAEAQGMGSRGVDDLDPNPNSGKEEKEFARDTTLDQTPTNKTRGEAK